MDAANGVNRRDLALFGMMAAMSAALPRGLVARATASSGPVTPNTGPTPAEALARLKVGHARFLAGDVPPAGQAQRLRALAGGQHPFAAIVCCSDSREPPELLFDTSVGELFVVRNAGNSVSPVALGSIEYAVEHLKVPLVMVLGHQRCGAVTAAVDVAQHRTNLPGNLGPMVAPLLAAARAAGNGEQAVEFAIDENIARTVTLLKDSGALLGKPLSEGKLAIVGGRLDLDTARISFFA